MKTDVDTRPQTTDGLDAKLARRFELHVADARRDYPRLQWQVTTNRRASFAPRGLVLAGAALVLVLVVAALLGSQLPVLRSSTLPAASHSAPASTPSAVTMGSDGIPVSIDGAHVYRPADVTRGTATGTFLLGGRVEMAYPSCQPFAGGCDPYFGLFQGVSHIAIKGLRLQPSWESAVVRGTIDPSCPPANRDGLCFPDVVAQSVVWLQAKTTPPLVSDRLPESIDGEPVFRLSGESAWRAIGGSFLLAGIAVDTTHPIAACPTGAGPYPMYPPENPAEARLLPVSSAGLCDGRNLRQLSLDGTTVDLAQSPAALPDGHLVVVRAHTHDPAAAECSTPYRTECDAAAVVEGVVWDLGPFVELGPDGVPTAIGVDTVHRAASLPPSGTVLLGGRLTWDGNTPCIGGPGQTCVPVLLDGPALGNGAKELQSLDGKIVVARVRVAPADSSTSSPAVSFLEIVWQEGGSATPSPGS